MTENTQPFVPRRSLLARLGEAWTLILGFAAIIALGAMLLRLPASGAQGRVLTWEEAVFTSASATTVTGLTVVNTAVDLSVFGQWVVLVLMQVGGVGFIAFSVLLFRLIGRRVTLQERFAVQRTVGSTQLSGVVPLAIYVLGVTLTLEAAGALLLFVRWYGSAPVPETLYRSVFHAISAYCNAGFDLFTGTDAGIMFGFGEDPFTLVVLMVLIVLGGLGIPVLYDLWSYRDDRRLSLHTKLTLVMTALLTGGGFVAFATDSGLQGGYFAGMDRMSVAFTALFATVSSRTAGLTILPLEALTPGTQLLTMVWMFIGAGPASMGGGVSMSTVAVILAAVVAHSRGELDIVAFGRTVPTETVYKAMAVMTVSTVAVAAATVALVGHSTEHVFPVAFEVVSAFSNTGYSIGHTADLDSTGRLIVIALMFIGRLGPLTFVVALAQRSHKSFVKYPEEPVILG